jgi:ribosomal-protein-alanine N-acetyltransferase
VISLRRLHSTQEVQFLEAVRQSRELHGDWVSPPSTTEEFASHLTRHDGMRAISYVAVLDDLEPVGCINLGEIVRGAFQSAYLGYYVFEPHAGKGLMRQALSLVVEEAFSVLGLHRLEANIQPANVQSKALVTALGFRLEGVSPRYLKIAGAWRDHERYAITAEENCATT